MTARGDRTRRSGRSQSRTGVAVGGGLAALAVPVLATVLGVAPAAAAAPHATVVTVAITEAQKDAVEPFCPTAYDITPETVQGIGLTRDVAVATCIQYFRTATRLAKDDTRPPREGAPVPPGADRRPVPLLDVRLAATAPTAPVTVRVPVPVPVRVPVTVPVPVDNGGSVRSSGGSSGGSSGSESGIPIGDGSSSSAPTTDPVDPGTTPAPSVAPLPAPGEAAPVLTDPAASATPVAVTGGPGTVSDPSTKTAASAATGGTGQVLPLALVIGAIILAAALGIGVRWAVLHDRLPTMPWSRRRGGDPATEPAAEPAAESAAEPAAEEHGPDAVTGTSLSPAGFVATWLSRADAPDSDVTDPGPGSLHAWSGPSVSLEKAGEHGPHDLGARRPEGEVEDVVGVGHHH